jgi:hypothetical protein
MSWKRRILELTLAGGVFALGGCGDDTTSGGNIDAFICNANPDPCCSAPNSQACLDSKRDLGARDMTSHD